MIKELAASGSFFVKVKNIDRLLALIYNQCNADIIHQYTNAQIHKSGLSSR